MVFRKNALWVGTIQHQDLQGHWTKLHQLVSPNAEGITVDGIKIRFRKSSSVSEIFAAELRSRPKSGQILHVFHPQNFFGVCPSKCLTGIIKFGLVLTIMQNFKPVGLRILEISRSEKNKHLG